MNEQLKTNLTSSRLWVRFVYMLLFSFFLYVASLVVCVVVVVQFLFCLLAGTDNVKLRKFGNSLAQYVKDALMFLTFNSEHKPFPFADWPEPLAELDENFRVSAVRTSTDGKPKTSWENRAQEEVIGEGDEPASSNRVNTEEESARDMDEEPGVAKGAARASDLGESLQNPEVVDPEGEQKPGPDVAEKPVGNKSNKSQ